ncbi:MAG TPA: MFS transporter [Gemmataceae bacterium]|nr:MFS transporter [Gemmataceae bacterium]
MSTPEPLPGDDLFGRGVLRKVAWRLLPFLCLLYLCNGIDRSNVGFARLTMQKDLGLSDAAFNFGYGIFYFGYLAFEVPANLLLRRVGARRWMARIMISWGFVSCATMLVRGVGSFYAVRIFLGVAEAGFFPGVILYLTFWFPARERARVVALFMLAIPITGFVSNLVSGALLEYLHGAGGLTGWQWLFLAEGLPSVVIGVLVLLVLPDGPSQASWLGPAERDWLAGRIEQEEHYRRERHGADFLRALLDGRVWLLIGLYFTVAVGANAAGANFPDLISKRLPAISKAQVGFLAALPSACAMVSMVLMGWHSDRTGERRGHVALSAFAAAGGWALSAVAPSPGLFLVGLCIAQAGMLSMLPTFWALPTSFLSGVAAAGGIALINSVGNIGGLVGPNIFGKFGLWGMVVILAAGGVLALFARHDASLDRGGPGEKAAGA